MLAETDALGLVLALGLTDELCELDGETDAEADALGDRELDGD